MNEQEQSNTPSGTDILRGGRTITLSTGEEVFLREVTPADVLEGKYIELLKNDIFACLEFIADRPEGWAKALSRDDWTAVRTAEEAINFDYALAEITAAHERGQPLKFIDEAIAEQADRLLKIMGSLGSSPSTAESPDPLKRKPSPHPSAGSPR
jgi:hypothetical protein